MSTGFFSTDKIAFEGPYSASPLAFRHYNPCEVIMGRRMEDHLRFAAAYWHSFAWPGGDPFGGKTFDRPWFSDRMADPMAAARLKADAAFEMFTALGVPYSVVIAEENIGFPAVSVQSEFLAPLRFGEKVRVELELNEIGKKSITCGYKITRLSDGVTAARATIISTIS